MGGRGREGSRGCRQRQRNKKLKSFVIISDFTLKMSRKKLFLTFMIILNSFVLNY